MANEKRLIDANALCEYALDGVRCGWLNEKDYDAIIDSVEEAPTVDAVYRGVHDQVRWERDIAIGQLESYGISLGEKADVAKVVHGRWIDAYGIRKSKCNNCGVAFGRVMDGDCHYCPNRRKENDP